MFVRLFLTRVKLNKIRKLNIFIMTVFCILITFVVSQSPINTLEVIYKE